MKLVNKRSRKKYSVKATILGSIVYALKNDMVIDFILYTDGEQ